MNALLIILLQEQFTPRWDYKGWENNEVSGEYSGQTNIYGLGLILVRRIVFHTLLFSIMFIFA